MTTIRRWTLSLACCALSFNKDLDDANRIMWQVHNNGVGECGVYTYEVADTKVTQVWITPESISIRCNASWKRSEVEPHAVILSQPRTVPSSRSCRRQRAPARIRDARTSAVEPADDARSRRRHARLFGRYRRCARTSVGYIDHELDNLTTDCSEDPKPTSGFQRVSSAP